MIAGVPSTISQIGYPGAGDIDDCWIVATVWAAIASDGDTTAPSATLARVWAGDPDDGHQDGGSLDETYAVARRLNRDAVRWESFDFDPFDALLRAGRPASCAVRSSSLPSALRFGFYGLHQIGGIYVNGRYYIMNPLDRSGRDVRPIARADLRRAMLDLIPSVGVVRGVLFPAPKETTMAQGLDTIPADDLTHGVLRSREGGTVIRLNDSARIPIGPFTRQAIGPVIRKYGNSAGYLIEHQGGTCWAPKAIGTFTADEEPDTGTYPVSVGGKLVGNVRLP